MGTSLFAIFVNYEWKKLVSLFLDEGQIIQSPSRQSSARAISTVATNEPLDMEASRTPPPFRHPDAEKNKKDVSLIDFGVDSPEGEVNFNHEALTKSIKKHFNFQNAEVNE